MRDRDSGIYQYFLNGERTSIEEYWTREWTSAAECHIHSGRRAVGVEIEVEARMADDVLHWCQLDWRATTGLQLQAVYELCADCVQVRVGEPGAMQDSYTLDFDTDSPAPLLAPLMRVFAGPVIAGLLLRGGEGAVVVPSIGEPRNQFKLLRPQLSQRGAKVLEDDVVLEFGDEQHVCRYCEYTGDPYGDDARFWLGQDNQLVRYQWPQRPEQHWDVWMQRNS